MLHETAMNFKGTWTKEVTLPQVECQFYASYYQNHKYAKQTYCSIRTIKYFLGFVFILDAI